MHKLDEVNDAIPLFSNPGLCSNCELFDDGILSKKNHRVKDIIFINKAIIKSVLKKEWRWVRPCTKRCSLVRIYPNRSRQDEIMVTYPHFFY
jgi:hypothetical protein